MPPRGVPRALQRVHGWGLRELRRVPCRQLQGGVCAGVCRGLSAVWGLRGWGVPAGVYRGTAWGVRRLSGRELWGGFFCERVQWDEGGGVRRLWKSDVPGGVLPGGVWGA
eukprot:633697-Rhodomonas_salina.1